MNEEKMRKDYERMPIDNLINILISSRREIERLNSIINELEKELDLNLPFKVIGVRGLKNKLQELKGDDNNGVKK